MYFYAIRGATTVKANDTDEILLKTEALLKEILYQNSLEPGEIISIIFSGTQDVDSVYPAVAARRLGMSDIPLLCCQEMKIPGSLPLCVRVMMHVQKAERFTPKHIYLEDAVSLRPDLLPTQTKLSIAIDGPAGAGKSTIAKLLSKKLKILYLDTGAMYRAIGLKMLDLGINPEETASVIGALSSLDIRIEYKEDHQMVLLDELDVTDQIRTSLVSKAASAVAVIPEVRIRLVELQREIAQQHSLVMDGRDIGTYVLPNADKKFFLTASIEERANRRWLELKGNGFEQDYDVIKQEIIARDKNDTERSFAPLKKAEDAILIDTSRKTIAEVIEEIQSYL